MSKNQVIQTKIKRFIGSESETKMDLLAVEEPLEIRLGFGEAVNRQQIRVSVTMRTPGNDFELAAGFLFTEGIITSIDDIQTIQYCTELNSIENQHNIVRVELKEHITFNSENLQRNFYTTSSCGVCGKASIEAIKQHCDKVIPLVFEFDKTILSQLTSQLNSVQTVFKHTGGIHASALFSLDGKLELMREDVGRHNALDKLIGAALSQQASPLSNNILLLSGRISFELVQKAAMAGIPVIAALGAPSSLAIETAHSLGIQLFGFLKEDKFNQYLPN